ncbi:lysylphosphatidylglycerol synthase transmembrane domain-containing protein [Desulfolutivibrio sulfoxidireducens]|uniref:lysylphosphatidylglycerol synthase transmembrane domain-containing protein n=1 Tax=Desulfolutivibrio sulfoxidireducens TaxID=2773299 RepID=UPI00159DC27C|nr:lysylphosphatidylglycerol synthase transmembrane domain-containing protein [Desulfolutivibrio sulfoxidireducens]QLA16752.1 flippase-like domain-containing protein [Desulfolutivibrio sulfoxidireducens]QLA20316.1 flippase-like domain-containing protein [Desulfolutivibrio sulfoxidireducens]
MLVKKSVGFALRFGLVAACLAYAFWGVDFGQLWHALSGYGVWAIFCTVAFSFLGYAAMALRFNYLTGHSAGFWLCVRAFFLGMAVNNIIPAKLGELAKAFYLRQAGGFSLSKGVTMVFWERFFDLNALLAMGLVVAAHFKVNLAFVPLAACVGGIWAALFVVRTFPSLVEKIIDLMPSARLSAFLADIKLQILHGVTPGFLAVLGLYTALCWALYAAISFLVLLWVASLPLTMGQAAAVFVLSALGMAMPSSPGAFGVFEAAVVFSLGLFGIDKEQALAAGVVLHMLQYIPVTLVGVLILARSGLSIKRIRESDEGLEEETES